jgi:MoxR-like ATPase
MSTASLPNVGDHVQYNGNGNGKRSRYRSTCPACKRPIEIDQPIAVYKTMGKRIRWKHADCNDVPEPVTGPTDLSSADFDALAAKVKTKLAELATKIAELKTVRPTVIEIHKPNGEVHKIEGAVHPVFKLVVELAQARRHIFLPGPSGCGKSHLAKQVAEALGLRFGCISCSAGMSESQLLGRMVPHGDHGQFEFLGTEFLDCYENGGVFLFDEIDAADSNVLLVINSALANGHLSVPSRHGKPVAERHPDFVCIAAANTWGRGADRRYVGRNELDESTLDRFRIGTVPMGYDESLETQLCPDRLLYKRLKGYRALVEINRIDRIVSTRFIAEAYTMTTQWGWDYERVDEQLFAGWREDETAKVRGSKGGA